VNEFGRKRSWSNFRYLYFLGVCLKGLNKSMPYLDQNTRYHDRDPKRSHSKYKSEALLIKPTCLVIHHADRLDRRHRERNREGKVFAYLLPYLLTEMIP
jgi:hypothetical protein